MSSECLTRVIKMPLKGEAKKNYQREYMRRHREGLTAGSNKGLTDTLETSLSKQGLNLTGNRVSLALQSTRSPLKTESHTRIPLYNRHSPQIGEKVKMLGGEIVIVPELDTDGNTIESGSTGRLVSDNLFKPSFQPDHKPEKKKRSRR